MTKVIWRRQRKLTAAPLFPQRERWYVVGQERLHAAVERYTYGGGWTATVKGGGVMYRRRRCDAKRAVEVALVALGPSFGGTP